MNRSYPQQVSARLLNPKDRSEAITIKHQGRVEVTLRLTDHQASLFHMTPDRAADLATSVLPLVLETDSARATANKLAARLMEMIYEGSYSPAQALMDEGGDAEGLDLVYRVLKSLTA